MGDDRALDQIWSRGIRRKMTTFLDLLLEKGVSMQLISHLARPLEFGFAGKPGKLLKGPDLCIWQKGSDLWEYRLFICPRGRKVYDFLGAAS